MVVGNDGASGVFCEANAQNVPAPNRTAAPRPPKDKLDLWMAISARKRDDIDLLLHGVEIGNEELVDQMHVHFDFRRCKFWTQVR